MAYQGMKFIPAQTPSPSVGALVPLEDIPKELRDDIEEAYSLLKANPSGRMHSVFDTKEEAAQFETWVRSYCAQRTVTDPAGDVVEVPIRYRKSPVKGAPNTHVHFRVTDLLTPNEAVTEDVREATEVANGRKPRKAAAKAAK
jgi:hypothetical protein